MPKPTTVAEYINSKETSVKEKLQEMRKILKEVVPNAKEDIKWGYPVFIGKRILFAYSAFKTHMSFMPTRSSLEPFAEELKDYTTGKDTIQFSYDKPLPKRLIQTIAAYRAKDVEENGALWMGQS